MSGKGNAKQTSAGHGGSQPAPSSEPTVVTGHQYHHYENGTRGGGSRYAYIGKDDSGTPQFLDYGRKGGR
jgi:hypothetical protein